MVYAVQHLSDVSRWVPVGVSKCVQLREHVEHAFPPLDVSWREEVTQHVEPDNETGWVFLGELLDLQLKPVVEPGHLMVEPMSERHIVAVAVLPLLTGCWACGPLFESERVHGHALPFLGCDKTPQLGIVSAGF